MISSPHGAGVAPNLEISDADFLLTARLIRDRFGIHLGPQKRAMLSGRLYKLVRESGARSFSEYFRAHLRDPSDALLLSLADKVSTNHTYFQRESEHFDHYVRTALPEVTERLQRQGTRDLRMWCAASSSGEEPYTLAMLQREFFGPRWAEWQAGLLATDISADVLQMAAEARYATEGVRRLPAHLVERYFQHHPDGTSTVVPAVRSAVTFRRFNLMRPEFPFRAPFQIIFIRNVMIYFEEDTKRALVDRLARATAPGGWVYIGQAETLHGLGSPFRSVAPGVYQKASP